MLLLRKRASGGQARNRFAGVSQTFASFGTRFLLTSASRPRISVIIAGTGTASVRVKEPHSFPLTCFACDLCSERMGRAT